MGMSTPSKGVVLIRGRIGLLTNLQSTEKTTNLTLFHYFWVLTKMMGQVIMLFVTILCISDAN